MKIKEIFGEYDKSNVDLFNKYIKETDNVVSEIQNFGYPFFKGVSKFKYIDYLANKKLNKESLNYQEILRDLSPLFENLPNWNNPGTMINVIPPVNIMALSFSSYAALYNPNFAQDTYAGHLITAELEVTKYLADLINWDWHKSKGIFTFGGKGTNLYATKIAISKINYDSHSNGVENNKYFMLSSQNAHPCHYQVCDWLGLGTSACIEIPCLANGEVDLDKTESIIDENIAKGKKFLGFNLNGGSTNEIYVDPVKKIYDLNQKMVNRYNLDYIPHIHIDSVIGWVFLFYKDYDFHKNELNIPFSHLSKIEKLYNRVKQFEYADSLGIDFHKTGFCPYISSLFICKDEKDYYSLNNEKKVSLDDLEYGNYNPYNTTLELTRSSQGALSALVSLKSLGIKGFQEIISKLFSSTEYFREKFKKNTDIVLLNPNTEGFATLFVLKPQKYKDLSYEKMLELNDNEIEEIRNYNQLFGKYVYNKALSGEIDYVFTASRSYVLPMTTINIGALKMYPMSIFLDFDYIDGLLNKINDLILSFKIEHDQYNYEIELKDDMVYDKK